MEVPPSAIAVISFFLLIGSAQAVTCSIDGDWGKASYNGGQTMKFSGSIAPTSGFIRAIVLNPFGDTVYNMSERQIYQTFQINFTTATSYLNGTYRVKVYYTKLSNTTACGEVVNEPVNLNTTNVKGNLYLNLTINQSLSTSPVNITGAPVETPLGTLTSRITGYGAKGLVPSITLLGTQLAPGTSFGNLNIALTECLQNEQARIAYQNVANFLASNYTNVMMYANENERLKAEIGNDSRGYIHDIRNLTTDLANSRADTNLWRNIAGGKWEPWLGLILGAMIGIAILLIIQARYGQEQLSTSPQRLPTSGIVVHKD